MKKLIIDADSLIYRATHICQTADTQADELETDSEAEDLGDLEEANTFQDFFEVFHSMVNEVVSDVERHGGEFEGHELVITVKGSSENCSDMEDNFRYRVMQDVADEAVKGYKANRAGMEVPHGLLELYDYVFHLDNTVCISKVEADDYCVYMGRQGHIIAAIDKDVIGSLDEAWNYGKKEWVATAPETIALFPYYQTLTGDSSDGLRGAYRIGPKKADVILADITDEYELWTAVVKTYFEKGQTLEEAIATMRCVRMDQWTPENGLVLWTPPKKDKDA